VVARRSQSGKQILSFERPPKPAQPGLPHRRAERGNSALEPFQVERAQTPIEIEPSLPQSVLGRA